MDRRTEEDRGCCAMPSPHRLTLAAHAAHGAARQAFSAFFRGQTLMERTGCPPKIYLLAQKHAERRE